MTDPNALPDASPHQGRLKELIREHDEVIASATSALEELEETGGYDWRARIPPEDEDEDEDGEMEELFGGTGKKNKKAKESEKQGQTTPKITMEVLEQFVKGKNTRPIRFPQPAKAVPKPVESVVVETKQPEPVTQPATLSQKDSQRTPISQERAQEDPQKDFTDVEMEVDVGLSSAFG
ncbi:hypothetical protein BT69DRAFT_627751 [Atractiella rhizophila]|nr:hypothetical protein BT69DRAFT_627751 [Atractiella rhizophila]